MLLLACKRVITDNNKTAPVLSAVTENRYQNKSVDSKVMQMENRDTISSNT